MLAQLGNVQFTVMPFNMNATDHDAGASFASHDVVGAHPSLEFVGEAQESWRVRGSIFPKKFGGLSEMDALHAMRRSGAPQFWMRGDGVPMGWVVIERVTEKATYLARDGVGQVIEFDIDLKRASSPSAAGGLAALFSLFS